MSQKLKYNQNQIQYNTIKIQEIGTDHLGLVQFIGQHYAGQGFIFHT